MTILESRALGAGIARLFSQAALVAVTMFAASAHAGIDGVSVASGDTVNLTASEGYISIADGGSVYSWGYSAAGAAMQLPGPTLIATEGDTITVTLTNGLPAAAGNVSIVFPGQSVVASGGEDGELTREAPTGGTVTYEVTLGGPGTYQYHSGTQPDLQVEMGLYGAIVVRPATASTTCSYSIIPAGGKAYDHADACFDREYLFLLSEVDIDIHQAAEQQVSGPGPIVLPAGAYHSEYWMINGRAGPDTMAAAGDALLPSQPYNILPRMHPGERLLLRLVGAGREMHPFHTHGNHVQVLARDGGLLVSETDPTKLAGPLLFTIPSVPGGTVDAIFEWTGRDLGWDMYGTTDVTPHTCDAAGTDAEGYYTVGVSKDPMDPAFAPNYGEYCADHDKPIPVTLPSLSSLAFGGFYSGSPYLGALGSLPPGEGGLNPDAGFTYMWHSHNERELVNNDVFPGGMMTMLIVEAPGTEIND